MFYFEIISKWRQFCTFFKFFLNVQSIILHDQPHTPKKYFHFSFFPVDRYCRANIWFWMFRQGNFLAPKRLCPILALQSPKWRTWIVQMPCRYVLISRNFFFKINILYFFLFVGYLFNDEKHRCVEEGEVSCAKTPDLLRISSEPAPIQLRVSQLESFFAQWSRF